MPSDGSAVVLLHGLCDTASAWQDVIPRLRSYHEVYAPTAIGHRGGPPAPQRPATIHDVVDWAERYLDEHDLQQPHLVGHSMGGFVAIELARRGRAKTVCALSPGGFWSSGDGLRKRTMAKVTSGAGMARLTRPIAGFALRSATVRRLWFRGSAAEHGDRITARRACPVDVQSPAHNAARPGLGSATGDAGAEPRSGATAGAAGSSPSMPRAARSAAPRREEKAGARRLMVAAATIGRARAGRGAVRTW